jgi:hypothetical protein
MTFKSDQFSLPCQTCSLCNVKIDSKDTVHFAFGKPGSRERLYARVCKHVNDRRCINADKSKLGLLTADDHYGSEEVSVEQLEGLLTGSPA